MNIKKKLALNFVIIWLLFVAMAVGVAYQVNKQALLVDNTIAAGSSAVTVLEDMLMQLEKTRRFEKEFFIYIGDLSKKKKYVKEWKESKQKVSELITRLIIDDGNLFTDLDKKSFVRWNDAIKFYEAEFLKIVDHYKNDNFVGESAQDASAKWTVPANLAIKEGKNALKPIFLEAAEIEERNERLLVWGREQMTEQSQMMVYITIAVSILAALYMLFVMTKINSAIAKGLKDITDNAKALSDGNMSARFPVPEIEELTELSAVLAAIRSKLLERNKR